jgi:PAS domain S-box-containing protein
MVIKSLKNKVTLSNNEINGRYKSLLDASPNGVLTISKIGIITFCNSTFLKLTGYSEIEIVGKHASKNPTLQKKDIPKYLKMVASAFKEDSLPEVNFEYITKSGKECYGRATMGLVKKDDKFSELLLVFRDTTDEKNTKKALVESERGFRNLIENTSDIIMRIRVYPKFKMEYISSSVVKVLGYSQKDNYKIGDLGLRIVHPEDRSLLEEMLKDNHDFKIPIIVRFNHKKGNTVWLESKFTPIYNKKGIRDMIPESITKSTSNQNNKKNILGDFLDKNTISVKKKIKHYLISKYIDAKYPNKHNDYNSIFKNNTKELNIILTKYVKTIKGNNTNWDKYLKNTSVKITSLHDNYRMWYEKEFGVNKFNSYIYSGKRDFIDGLKIMRMDCGNDMMYSYMLKTAELPKLQEIVFTKEDLETPLI